MSLWLIRHGERIDKIDKSWVNNNINECHDPFLTKKGKWQAKMSGKNIRRREDKPIQYIYTSPFTRCVETSIEMLKEIRKKSENKNCLIRIELGICECIGSWMHWHKILPKNINAITNKMTLEYFSNKYPNYFDIAYKSYWLKLPFRESKPIDTIYRFYKTIKHLVKINNPLVLCTHSLSLGQIILLFDKTMYTNLITYKKKKKHYENLTVFSEVINKRIKDPVITEYDIDYYKNTLKDSGKHYCCIVHLIKENNNWKLISGPSTTHWTNRIKDKQTEAIKPKNNIYNISYILFFSTVSLFSIIKKN